MRASETGTLPLGDPASGSRALARWLRQLRVMRGVSQEELARRAGVSVLTYGRAERGMAQGRRAGVTVDTCLRIVFALNPELQEVHDLLTALFASADGSGSGDSSAR